MMQRGPTRLLLTIALFFIAPFTTSVFAQDDSAKEAEQIDLKAFWKKVVEVNQGWVEPQPRSLSYKIVSGSPPLAVPETTQFVWISGEKARWEMESKDQPKELQYTLITTPARTEYVRGPESLLGKNLRPQPLAALRQAYTWHSAMHALQHTGLPDEAKVVSVSGEGGDRIVVVQADPGKGRSLVGLGLFHLFYGSSQRPMGQTKLTLRLSDHIPLREEFADGTVIEYDPQYLKLGNSLAPKSVRYISKIRDKGLWVLAAEFQVVDETWLLKSAQNIQLEKVVKVMNVEDVSTQPIADEKFAIPENGR